jgi:HEAT repeat protein
MDEELSRQVYSVLERANRSGDAATRAVATEVFATLRPADTKAYAVDALKDPVFEVRAAAIRALIRLRDNAYKEVLTAEMTNPRRDLSADIMPILAMLSDSDAVSLAHAVLRDPRAPTKNAVIEAFGRLSGSRLTAFFRPLIRSDDQAMAEGVQGYILTLRALDTLPLYQQILQHGTPAMQLRALDALKEFPQGTRISFLRRFAQRARSEELKIRAAETLAYHGDRSATRLLLPNLQSENDELLIRTLTALVNVAGRELYGALEPLLRKQDTNPEVLRLALEIHHKTNSTSVVDVLQRLRNSTDVRTQAIAMYYLGVIERGRALPMLHEDLSHGAPVVRLAAVQAVGSIGSPESISHLERILDGTREPGMRTEIVKALAGIRDRRIIPIVSFLITDPTPGVRRWAIVALTQAGHVDAVSSLKIATQDVHIETRAEAVRAIIKLDTGEGLTVFRVALGWLSPAHLRAFAEELGEGFLPFIDIALTTNRSQLRQAAMEILAGYPAHELNVLVQVIERTRDQNLKIAILQRLAERNGAAEQTRLVAAYEQGSKPMKAAILRIMGTLPASVGDTLLRQALFDSDELLRVTAAAALVALDSQPRRRRGRRSRGRR